MDPSVHGRGSNYISRYSSASILEDSKFINFTFKVADIYMKPQKLAMILLNNTITIMTMPLRSMKRVVEEFIRI